METMRNDELGFVVSVTGARAGVRLYKRSSADGDGSRVTIGRLVAINTGASRIVGVITRVSVSEPEPGVDGNRGMWIEDPDGNRIEIMEMAPNCIQYQAVKNLQAGKAPQALRLF